MTKARIHSTAIISPEAELGSDVEIGPFAIIGENCVVGDGCVGGNPGTITAVVDTTPPGTLGGLYVFWLGTGVLLLSA